MKDPELIIEGLSSEADSPQNDGLQTVAEAEAVEKPAEEEPAAEEPSRGSSNGEAIRRLKEQVSEDDEAPVGTLTLRQIVGGDYLLVLVRHYLWFIMLVVLLTCIYIGVRYQCQQDVIEISRLEKELVDAKYRAMSSSSNLTEMCRQSNVLKVLSENEDNELRFPEQPPYIVNVGD